MSKKFWPSIAMAMTAAMTRFTLGAGAVASSVADDVRGIRGVRPAMRARLARKFKRRIGGTSASTLVTGLVGSNPGRLAFGVCTKSLCAELLRM